MHGKEDLLDRVFSLVMVARNVETETKDTLAILEKQLLKRCRTFGPRPAGDTVDEIPIHGRSVTRKIVTRKIITRRVFARNVTPRHWIPPRFS